jgi:hypothetical protein
MAHWLAGFWEPAAVFMIAVLVVYRNLVTDFGAALAARMRGRPPGGAR